MPARSSITGRRLLGAAFVPEERLGHGAAPRMKLSENLFLSRHATDAQGVPRRRRSVNRRRDRGAPTAHHRGDGRAQERRATRRPAALSGGNLQKFIVGRELDREPDVLVVNQPTWGVDAGAAATIRQSLIDLARSGSAVLVISQDLDELFEISDRIAVMSQRPAVGADADRRGDAREDRPADGRRRPARRRNEEAADAHRTRSSGRSTRRCSRVLSPFIALGADAGRRRDPVRAARQEPVRGALLSTSSIR